MSDEPSDSPEQPGPLAGWPDEPTGPLDRLRMALPPISIGSAVAAVAVLGIIIWLGLQYAASPTDTSGQVEPVLPMSTPLPTEVTEQEPTPVVVHVAGAVTAPGVYVLESGSRWVDALGAAGGALDDADLGRLNLAGLATDGSQIYVPREGEPAPSTSQATGQGSASAPTGPVDVNTADAVALEALPGIGPTTATAIVDHRDEHGPFTTLDELLVVPGIGPAKLEAIRDLAIAG